MSMTEKIKKMAKTPITEFNDETLELIRTIHSMGVASGHERMSKETAKKFDVMEQNLERIVEEIKEIKSDLNKRMEEIQESVKPAVSAISASKVLASFIKWTAGTMLSMTAIWIFFKEIIKLASK